MQGQFKLQLHKRYEKQFEGAVYGSNVKFLIDDKCFNAYKQFLCQWNFPSCDSANNLTQALCKTVCDQYIEACNSESEQCALLYPSIVRNSLILVAWHRHRQELLTPPSPSLS